MCIQIARLFSLSIQQPVLIMIKSQQRLITALISHLPENLKTWLWKTTCYCNYYLKRMVGFKKIITSYCGLNSVKQCCKCHQQQVLSLQWRLAAPTLCLLLWWYILTDLSMSISLSYDANDAGVIITASLIKCWLVYANMGLAPCTIYAPCQGKGASSLPTALVDPWHALVLK